MDTALKPQLAAKNKTGLSEKKETQQTTLPKKKEKPNSADVFTFDY